MAAFRQSSVAKLELCWCTSKPATKLLTPAAIFFDTVAGDSVKSVCQFYAECFCQIDEVLFCDCLDFCCGA